MAFTFAGHFADLMGRVEVTDTCWLWTGATSNGYGQVTRLVDGVYRKFYVHRIAYEQTRAPIPAGLVIDHLCRVPRCVNPSHLEAVTHVENTMRGMAPQAINARKTTAPCGHEYDHVEKGGNRRCYACSRAAARERGRIYLAKKKQVA